MAIKRCIAPFATFADGVPRVVAGGALLDADDPAVKNNPAAFEDVETAVERTAPKVEQATAAPGEKRTRRSPQGRRSAKGD